MTTHRHQKKSSPQSHHHQAEHRHRAAAGALLVMAFFAIVAGSFWVRSLPVVSSVNARSVDLTGFRLEIADTNESRRVGLGGHAPLSSEEGMLFVFPEAGIYPFWMKDMSFPIDIIWLYEGRVVDIATLQPPSAGSITPETHVPMVRADQVLEINAGRAAQLGIEKGSLLIFP